MSKVHLLESRGSMYYVVVLHTEGPCGYGGAALAAARRTAAAAGRSPRAASSTELNFDTVPSSTLLLCSLSSADGLKLF
mgnify:CR=1 FL=1